MIMLRINRKPGESVIITAGEHEIVVTIDKIERGYVRMSVQAPPSVIIDREEIHRKKVQGR